MSTATFQAKRNYTSGELIALRRQQVERTLTRAPSINLQDNSEITARKRKAAAVVSSTRGNSSNMVKWNDCSVAQAMREGDAYRTSSTNRQVRPDTCTVNSVPNQFLYDTQVDHRFPTVTRAIQCEYQIPAENRVVQPFNLAEHFGMGQNTNKTVRTNPAFSKAWASCDRI